MPELIQIREIRQHDLSQGVPESIASQITMYPEVNLEKLKINDPTPYFLTREIARVGEISGNGLSYDEELVQRIGDQLRGKSGIRGHIKKDDEDSAFPVPHIYWVGHKRIGESLYAMGYVPPGETRDDLIVRDATGGTIGTSIWGKAKPVAVRELKSKSNKRVWRAQDFRLDQVDLASPSSASLQLDEAFELTIGEMLHGEDDPVPDEITINDVPQRVREMIIEQAQGAASTQRVAELQAELSAAAERVAELEQSHQIVTALAEQGGVEPGQIVTTVAEMRTVLQGITGHIEVESVSEIPTRIQEMVTRINDFARKEREATIQGRVSEMTKDWQVSKKGQERLEKMNLTFSKRVLSELTLDADEDRIKETVNTIWDEEFKDQAETIRETLAGPPAAFGRSNGDKKYSDKYVSEEGRSTMNDKFSIGGGK